MSFKNAKIVSVGADDRTYHGQNTVEMRGDGQFIMSSSALREFAACPSRWRAGYVREGGDAESYGSLLDCLLLTPKQFDARYALHPETYTNEKGDVKPWNWNANVCKQWREDRPGIETVTAKELKEVETAINRLKSDPVISLWLDSCDTQIWVAGEWHDEKTGIIVPVQALLDFAPRMGTVFEKSLGDLKSTRNAAVMSWQRWCFTAQYHLQGAFYADLYTAATGEDRNTFVFVVQENYAPFEPAKRMLSQDFLTLGRASYVQMMENYCQCLKSDKWPGYDDTDESIQGWTLVQPEPFMAERAAFAPRYEFGEEDAPPEFPHLQQTSTRLVNIGEVVP